SEAKGGYCVSPPKRSLFCKLPVVFNWPHHCNLRNLPEFRQEQQNSRDPAYRKADHQFFLFAGSFIGLLSEYSVYQRRPFPEHEPVRRKCVQCFFSRNFWRDEFWRG